MELLEATRSRRSDRASGDSDTLGDLVVIGLVRIQEQGRQQLTTSLGKCLEQAQHGPLPFGSLEPLVQSRLTVVHGLQHLVVSGLESFPTASGRQSSEAEPARGRVQPGADAS